MSKRRDKRRIEESKATDRPLFQGHTSAEASQADAAADHAPATPAADHDSAVQPLPFTSLLDDDTLSVPLTQEQQNFLQRMPNVLTEEDPASYLYFDHERTEQYVAHFNGNSALQAQLPIYISSRVPSGVNVTVRDFKAGIVERAMAVSGRAGATLTNLRIGELVGPNTLTEFSQMVMCYTVINCDPFFVAMAAAVPTLLPIAIHTSLSDRNATAATRLSILGRSNTLR